MTRLDFSSNSKQIALDMVEQQSISTCSKLNSRSEIKKMNKVNIRTYTNIHKWSGLNTWNEWPSDIHVAIYDISTAIMSYEHIIERCGIRFNNLQTTGKLKEFRFFSSLRSFSLLLSFSFSLPPNLPNPPNRESDKIICVELQDKARNGQHLYSEEC